VTKPRDVQQTVRLAASPEELVDSYVDPERLGERWEEYGWSPWRNYPGQR